MMMDCHLRPTPLSRPRNSSSYNDDSLYALLLDGMVHSSSSPFSSAAEATAGSQATLRPGDPRHHDSLSRVLEEALRLVEDLENEFNDGDEQETTIPRHDGDGSSSPATPPSGQGALLQ